MDTLVDDPFEDRFRGIIRQIELEMADVERQVDRIMKTSRETMELMGRAPVVFGWTLRLGPDGIPRFRTFGNRALTPDEAAEGWREPFVSVDVTDKGELVHIMAELPGVPKEKVEVEVVDETVRIEAHGKDRNYRTEISTGHLLDPDSAKASFEHGLLDLRVKLLSPVRPPGRKVDIA